MAERKKLTDGRLRKCISMHWCCVCQSPISLGELYYDAGPHRRAHAGTLGNDCAGMASRGECREHPRKEQDSASKAYYRERAREALVRSEPEWAVNVIRMLRALLKEVVDAADACDKEAERPSQSRSSAPLVRMMKAIERAREALGK